MRVRMKTYGPSRSGVKLSRELGILRLRVNTRFRARRDDLIINWGSSFVPEGCSIINHPMNVRSAIHKEISLGILTEQGVPCPEFTTDKEIANEWLEDGETVVARGLTRGHSGRGISIVCPDGDLPDVPLYTRYVKKRDEYRVFVVDGRAVRVSQKRGRRGDTSNYQIRTASHGWVYCQDNVEAPSALVSEAVRSVGVLGLDFGAVDVGWNEHLGAPCIYEVNTAFGLEGATLPVVAQAIRESYL